MGCTNAKKVSYNEHEYDEEAELRKFEEEIGAFKKDLNHILPRICIEKDIIPITNVENNILKDFSATFINFIQQGYFYKEVNGKKYYDARKLNLLLFLLTNDTVISNSKISYHDKASFFFTFVKTREDQNLCEALEENEENFVKFIEDIVDIACVGIIDCYTKMKINASTGMMVKFATIKTEIVDSLIKNLFFSKNQQRAGGLTFDEVNAKFGEDKFLFTSGYIREVAWQILIKGKANEMEAKEREEAAAEKTAEKAKK
jgi:hypothetical protein